MGAGGMPAQEIAHIAVQPAAVGRALEQGPAIGRAQRDMVYGPAQAQRTRLNAIPIQGWHGRGC
ncbi:MAG: hypothetical protein AMXMBFR45_07130 [Gammaproteobacteria bacterium]